MYIPLDAIIAMKKAFAGPAELRRMAKAMKVVFTREEAERMWSGDFSGLTLEKVEGWWMMCGYRLQLRFDKTL